jgi:hypothetical protein
MSLRSLRRRLAALERNASAKPLAHGSFTEAEMKSLIERIERGESVSADELALLERWGPAFAGDLAVNARQGKIWIKRYVGINLAEL